MVTLTYEINFPADLFYCHSFGVNQSIIFLCRGILGGSKPRQCRRCHPSALQYGHRRDLHLRQPIQHTS